MSSKDTITKDGKVTESLMGGMFKIELDGEEETREVLGTLSGKMRKFKIKILPGDRVKIEFSHHDLTRGRISFRYR
ncbi:translation initiation factor IF-1 [candidate division WWE3 bacterium]|jgi:translation initiation factor IF-1|uniref:Translation initiation factor IF-1 n=1 Tax=candidate division WWE3 bacterium TaxID=2053526 RepID=A0A3A4ZE55_UNCKA|nr:MAG: translation initiation factor IF-1 [candidate division WWE3 bacterium]